MLTREHAVATLNFCTRTIEPDCLRQRTHAHYLPYAEQMLGIYRNGYGLRRGDLHRAIDAAFAEDPECHPRRIGAFCKLLDEKSVFSKGGHSAKFRSAVFLAAGRLHPLIRHGESGRVGHSEAEVMAAITKAVGLSRTRIEAHLFDDMPSFNRLMSFDSDAYPNARSLLSRYNVAQFQVALFDATQLRIHATIHLKAILRLAKLARLMHTIRRDPDGSYDITLDGPASVLAHTRRYGTCIAKFLPGLLSCTGWSLVADIQHPTLGNFQLSLDPGDGLQGRSPPPQEFDSNLECAFARKWGREPRSGWHLERESHLLIKHQHVFFPDFVLRHDSGMTVLVEIIGFWTPEYFTKKYRTLAQFKSERLLLIVRESKLAQFSNLGFPTVSFKNAISLAPVLGSLGL